MPASALIELAERFDTLPMSVQEELDPFFRAPSDPLSWHQLAQASEVAPKDVNPRFDYIEAIDGKVPIQWPKQSGELREDAERVAAALSGPDGVWAKLTTLMGREPIGDDGIIEKYNGGDERFDIYIVKDINVVTRDLQTAFGWTQPYRAGADGTKRATYLVMNRDRLATPASGLELEIKSNLAHEFMHVLQFAYDVAESWSTYLWVMESTATWTFERT